jgi:glutaredoxin
MSVLPEAVKERLRQELAERMDGPVQLTLYTRPGTGRLILPSGVGCPTCDDARQLAEELHSLDPERIQLEVIDVSKQPSEVKDVPTLALAASGEEPRIRWQGLPAGYEFATVVDAIERLSSGDHGLSEGSVRALERLQEPLEAMVFTTPG